MKTEVVKTREIKDSRRKISNAMKIWIGVGIIFILSGICVLLQAGNSATITLEAGFANASMGTNPDGSPFNIHEVHSDEVLENAAEKLGGKMTSEEIKAHLYVLDLSDAEKIKKTAEHIVNGYEYHTAFPTTYSLKYSTVSEKIKEKGMVSVIGAFFKQFALPSKSEILKAVSESYIEYYNNKYIVSSEALDVNWSGADGLDHYNKGLYAKKVLAKLTRFIQVKHRADVDYVSESGIGYGDLLYELNTISATDLENYEAYVVQNGISSDEEALKRQFNYMKRKNLDVQLRKGEEYKINKRAIEIYDPDVTKVVFIPSLDIEKNFYMNRTKVGVDYLVENANLVKKAADDAEHAAIRYEYLASSFKGNPEADEAQAEALFGEITKKIDLVVASAKVMADDDIIDNGERLEAGDVKHGFNLVWMIIKGGKLFVMLLLIAFVLFNLCDAISKKAIKKR